jgi:hypothetical protein
VPPLAQVAVAHSLTSVHGVEGSLSSSANPKVQFVQLVAPGPEYWPTAHGAQGVEGTALNLPAPQLVHVVVPAGAYRPGTQAWHAVEALASVSAVPALQGEHTSALMNAAHGGTPPRLQVATVWVPAGQLTQGVEAFASVSAEPAEHWAQLVVELAPPYLPPPHITQGVVAELSAS